MKKRILAIFLCLILAVSLAAAVAEVPATPDYSEALAKVCW